MAAKKKSRHPVDEAFKPIPVHEPGTPEYEHSVNGMRDRIVQTYLAATPQEHYLGERFYSHDAHGAAQAMAGGVDPSSGVGQMLRRTGGTGRVNPERDFGNRPEYSHRVRQAEEFVGNLRKQREAQGMPEHPAVTSARQRVEEFRARTAQPGHSERVRRAAGVIARLSPQTEWETNVRQAHEVYGLDDNPTALSNLRNNVRDPSRPKRRNGRVVPGEFERAEVRDESGRKMELNQPPTAAILKAHDIATGYAEPEDFIPMHPRNRVKVGSFAHNIEHPESSPHTTVDFRAHDIATGQLLSTGTDRGLSGNPKAKSRSMGARRYDMIEEAHNRAADVINSEHPDRRLQGHPIQPKQVQAVTWWADKNYQDERMGGVQRGGHLHAGADGGTLRRPDLGRPVGQSLAQDRGTQRQRGRGTR